MLTWEEELEAEALFKRGWKITVIARHLGRDPKTIRAYLSRGANPEGPPAVDTGDVRPVRWLCDSAVG